MTYSEKTGAETGLTVSRYLKEAEVKDVSMTKCQFRKKQICVEGKVEGETGCRGDDGGPIHRTKNGKTSVVGRFLGPKTDRNVFLNNFRRTFNVN